jgi:hypothetical protein
MNGHRTARALVIDDNVTDGAAFLRALSSLSIGALYLTGDEEETELPKLTGIRLLAVDMDLNTGQTETKAMLGKVLKLVRTVLATDNGPFVLIAWTEKDQEVVEDFQAFLVQGRRDLRPCLLLRLKKSEVLSMEKGANPEPDAKRFDIAAIRNRILEQMAEWWPLDLILEWEQIIHDAASTTTASLAEIVSASADSRAETGGQWTDHWKTALADTLDTLVRASGGQGIRPQDAFKHLLEVLNPLHNDRVEHLGTVKLRSAPALSAAKLLRSSPPEKLDSSKKAKLNRMLLVAETDASDNTLYPGNIYWNRSSSGKHLFAKCGLTKKMLVQDLAVDPSKEPSVSPIKKQLNTEINKPPQKRDQAIIDRLSSQLRSKEKAMLAKAIPIMVEVTASCDHAQLNQRCARLVGGLLLPSEEMISTSPSKRILEPVQLDDNTRGLKGIYTLALSARFIFGLPKNRLSAIPIARLRTSVLVDIQSWLASQVARPGYLSIADVKQVRPLPVGPPQAPATPPATPQLQPQTTQPAAENKPVNGAPQPAQAPPTPTGTAAAAPVGGSPPT